MKPTGEVKILSEKGWETVPTLHRWTTRLGDSRTPVEFALHLSKSGLHISEVSTGCDTQAVVLHPRTGRRIVPDDLKKGRRGYLPGNEVRKLARSALHAHLTKISHQAFLRAVAHQVLSQAAVRAREAAKEGEK